MCLNQSLISDFSEYTRYIVFLAYFLITAVYPYRQYSKTDFFFSFDFVVAMGNNHVVVKGTRTESKVTADNAKAEHFIQIQIHKLAKRTMKQELNLQYYFPHSTSFTYIPRF